MSMAKGLSALQPVYQPTTLPFSTMGRSYLRPPTSPTGHTDTPLVDRIWEQKEKSDFSGYVMIMMIMTTFMVNEQLQQEDTLLFFL